jgi:hypothetical protein
MPKKSEPTPVLDVIPLSPFEIIRLADAQKYFGLASTELAGKIASGEIDQPKFITAPGGRARGFTGAQIIAHHRKMEAWQTECATAAKKYYDSKPKPGHRKDGKPVSRRAKAEV